MYIYLFVCFCCCLASSQMLTMSDSIHELPQTMTRGTGKTDVYSKRALHPQRQLLLENGAGYHRHMNAKGDEKLTLDGQ